MMSAKYPLFSQVALAKDLPEYQLERGEVGTIVEYFPMPEGQEDGYSIEGFDVPNVTVEVAASQIVPVGEWEREELILGKLRQLSTARQLELEDYLDFLLQKEGASQERA